MDTPDFSELTGNIEMLHNTLSEVYNKLEATIVDWQRKLNEMRLGLPEIYREVQSLLRDVESSASTLESEVEGLETDVDFDEVKSLVSQLSDAVGL